MNDLEREIRETLHRHEDDAPTFDASDARRAAGRTRRRQILNVAGAGLGILVVVIGLVAGLTTLEHADRPPIVIDTPPPSLAIDTPSPSTPPSSMACGEPPTSAATPLPKDARALDWPDTSRNPPGVYAWDGPGPIGNSTHLEGFMHNGYSRSPGEVSIFITGPEGHPLVPGRIVPHSGQCAIVAEHEGTYRRFIGRSPTIEWGGFDRDDAGEEWMVDIRGTTIVITLAADPRTPEAELAEAYEIVESISVDPDDSDLGFRLIFTIPTDTWDSG